MLSALAKTVDDACSGTLFCLRALWSLSVDNEVVRVVQCARINLFESQVWRERSVPSGSGLCGGGLLRGSDLQLGILAFCLM